MKIAIGSDHAGYALKDRLKEHMQEKGLEVIDCGGFAPEEIHYPVIGEKVARMVVDGEVTYGILICGTGVGISLAANKVPGIRCVVCSEPYSAKLARQHNDANMLSMGARVIGSELAVMILDEFLAAEHEGGNHPIRVAMIKDIETKYNK